MEHELQYVYVGTLQPSVPTELAGMTLAGSDRLSLTDTYFDTEDLALRNAGCTLRIRVGESGASPRLTWKGPSKRRRNGHKRRAEVELRVDVVPQTSDELETMLRRFGLDRVLRKKAGVDTGLQPIGQLQSERSRHHYVQGLHRLELTWDKLSFPRGPDKVWVEVEARSSRAHRYLSEADRQLRRLFADDLEPAKRGKVRELCERLYPELVGAG